jgi:hypothetical protein
VARKVLLAQLDQPVKDLEAMERQPSPSATLDRDLSYYLKLRADREFLAGLSLTWENEPFEWRRSLVRRFISRLDIHVLRNLA